MPHLFCTQFQGFAGQGSHSLCACAPQAEEDVALRGHLLPLLDGFSWVWMGQSRASRECPPAWEWRSPHDHARRTLAFPKPSDVPTG